MHRGEQLLGVGRVRGKMGQKQYGSVEDYGDRLGDERASV